MATLKPITVPIEVVVDVSVIGTAYNFEDVGDFHRKFDLHTSDAEPGPVEITSDLIEFRTKFMQEELDEFKDAVAFADHPAIFDALLDLVYVAMGTAHLFGYPWQEGWDEVQRANMEKLRATTAEQSLRGSTWDVVKGPDWTPPDIAGVLREVGFE
jgi:predicted HAD superfamily Cof-like phosphohydrolase